MKTRFIFHILLVTVIVFLASCVKEGPAGIAGLDGADGADGADGQDGNVTCTACHTGTTLATKQIQYASSTHKAGVNVAYAGGRSYCAECHSSEGFIEYQLNGFVASNISSPSAITCETCHLLHTDFDYADYELRAYAPLALNFDETVVLDLGDGSNLCINCHQSRRAEPNMVTPGEETFAITSTHYGPHHGPQANVFDGNGFAEIAGTVAYPDAGGSLHRTQASCITCHMGEYSDGEGDHTWKPSLATCNACHSVASENFDYGGRQTNTQLQLDELRDLLLAAGVVTGDDVDGYHPVVGTYSMVQVQAFFNWIGLEEDRSLGAHNPQYVNALLVNTIDALKVTK